MRISDWSSDVCSSDLLAEGLDDAGIHRLVAQIIAGLAMDIERNRHPPGALAADHPIRPTLDHRADAVLRARGDPASLLDGGEGGLAECFPSPSWGGDRKSTRLNSSP